LTAITIQNLAEIVGGIVHGASDVLITGAASIADAEPGDVVFAEDRKYLAAAKKSMASAVVCTDESCGEKTVIQVADPRRAFVEILTKLAPEEKPPKQGVDQSCRVGERTNIADSASVGYGCFIGDDVIIEEGTIIHPLVYLGDGVRVGKDSVIFPNVTVYPGCEIGSRVRIHSGSAIGSDGFGYMPVGNKIFKIVHLGKVVIEDDVEIGACVTIDRAKTGATRVGRSTKIDNQVQVAHNVKTGESCIIAGQVGLAGSIELGNGVTIAGQAGLRDHIKVGDGVVIAGQSGVDNDLPSGGAYSGYPVRPHRETMRIQLAYLRLPELQRTVTELTKEIETIKSRLAQLGGDEIAVESK
jgi:UDP-3-O-[3-hydroxymyristoyl] glucosamine N-acyltransferase